VPVSPVERQPAVEDQPSTFDTRELVEVPDGHGQEELLSVLPQAVERHAVRLTVSPAVVVEADRGLSVEVRRGFVLLDQTGERRSQRVAPLDGLQHHGVPTRLIDVTANSLTALWFAAESTSRMRPADPEEFRCTFRH
jgi:hypothetical protein